MTWSPSTRRLELPPDWPRLRLAILERDHHRCQLCGAPATTVDHIVEGNDHRPANLRALCKPCHDSKSARRAQLARYGLVAKRGQHHFEPHPGYRGDSDGRQ